MKFMMTIAVTGILAGCAPDPEVAEDPNDTVVDEVTEMEAEATAPDGGPVAGTYEVTDAEGVTRLNMLNEDGTYSYGVEGEDMASGTYTANEDMSVCFVDAVEGGDPICVTPDPASADGSWQTTRDDGAVFTVRRRDG